ncbi:Septation protein SUN4 [Verticillium dahliae VDG1]|nr:Septation protein SUN4 [Verticillium dahliae VDG1]
MTTIRRALISGFGDASHVKIVTETIDAPGKNEVQVDVIYSGFSGADINMRDLVGAVTVYDSEADKINVEEKYLGKRIFIHGLSGAVGYATLTLCLLEGADVYGTASLRNHEALRRLGVTPFVYTDKAWMGEMRARGGAHVVYDALGFESYDEPWEILVRDEPSRLVGFGGNLNAVQAGSAKPRSQLPGTLKLLAKNGCLWTKRSAGFYYIDRTRDTYVPDLQAVLQLLAEGKFKAPIKKIWDLDNIREPHEQWTKVTGMGSCLIRVDQNA